jgi:predicted PurR-regulated permease PerM
LTQVINATCAWIMLSIVGIRYAAVLAGVAGLLGQIPMVGPSLGAPLLALVALFDPTKAVIALVHFVALQQLEHYVVAPKTRQRTVSVRGAVTVIAAGRATLLGMLGALLAIPAAGGHLLICEKMLLPRQHQN